MFYLNILKHKFVTKRHYVTHECNNSFFILIKWALFLDKPLTHLTRL